MNDRDEVATRGALYDRHAQQLGRLCMLWAVLDVTLDKLLAALLQVSAEKLSAITTGAGDTSARCEMIKRLIVIENPGTAWRDWLIDLVKRVTDELGPMRNRYVHDHWDVSGPELVRTERRGKTIKPQARGDLQYTFDMRHVTPPGDVEKLNSKVALVFTMLAFAEYDLKVWRQKGQPLEPLPEYIPASRKGGRYMTPQEHATALREGRPTSELVFD